MIKIQDVVRDIVFNEEEALYSLSQGYMNFSAYAKKIHKEVEERTKKEVEIPGIVVALSRVKKEVKNINPLIQDVDIDNITTKSPLSEIVFEKTPDILSRLSSFYKSVKTSNDDFLTITLATGEVTVICSDRIKKGVLSHFKDKPMMIASGLASLGISIDKKYYPMPNITFSLIRRIARKRIALAETITTYNEIIFIFSQENLSAVLKLFTPL